MQTAGSNHLFQIYGQLTPDQITLERKYLWDALLLHAMLRQETSRYALDNTEYLLPPSCLEESEI